MRKSLAPAPTPSPYREPPPPPQLNYDYAAAVEAQQKRGRWTIPAAAALQIAVIALPASQGDWRQAVKAAIPPAIGLALWGWHWAGSECSDSHRAMNGWFSPKRAVTDAVIAGAMSLFMLFWFGQVLGVTGSLLLIGGMFGLFQLLRFMNAQLATLEWARLQESGRDEKKPVIAMPRGDGYRDVAEREAEPEPDADFYEKEIPRRRRKARIALGVVGGIGAALALLPGIAFGAWTFPAIVAFLTLTMAAFRFGMRAMQRGEARPLPAPAAPRVRIGVDFGVPQPAPPLATEDEELEEGTPRRRSAR